MKIFTLLISCYFLLFSSFNVSASNEKFYVVVGLAKPPYVIQETNSGFEIELIENILTRMNKRTEFIYVPFGRSIRMLQNERIDAIMTANDRLISDQSLLSDPYIIYQNVAITRKDDNIVIPEIKALKDMSIAAFQTAHKILGDDFAQTVKGNKAYYEVADQRRQTKLLFDNKVQALVMDINIFKKLSIIVGAESGDVAIHKIFPKNPYRMAFKAPENVKAFNQVMHEYRKSDDYQKLIAKYNVSQQDF